MMMPFDPDRVEFASLYFLNTNVVPHLEVRLVPDQLMSTAS